METQILTRENLKNLVIRILGFNAGPMTLTGTNTYLIGKYKSRFLIDTGEGKAEYKQLLQKIIQETSAKITQVLITHYHYDHTGGIQDVLEIFPQAQVYKLRIMKEDEALENEYKFKYINLQENQVIEGEQFQIRVIKTPGHCSDHLSFVLEQEKVLFTGDCVLGGSSNRIENLKEQLTSLDLLTSLDVQNIYPAHGHMIIGREETLKYLNQTKQHRLKREQEVLEGVRELKSAKIPQLLQQIYPEITNETLQLAAMNNIMIVINKLIDDKRVLQNEDSSFSLSEN